MNYAEFDAILARTLVDHRLTGGEKKGLADWLAGHRPTEQDLGVLRSRAFDAARTALADPEAPRVLDWLEGVLKLLHGKPAGTEDATFAEAYFSPGEECYRTIVRHFDQARRSCDVCVYTITDNRISGAILAAHHRGVRLRIISDQEKEADPGSDVERFRQAGIPVRVSRTLGHMHHKFALFDGTRLLTGSYNWTRGAAEQNEENFIVTANAHLLAAFAAAFERLWKKLEHA